MPITKNSAALRGYLVQSRQLIEPYGQTAPGQAYLYCLDQALGPYFINLQASGLTVTDHHLQTLKTWIDLSQAARQRNDLDTLFAHTRQLILALPGDPTTLPSPPTTEPPKRKSDLRER